MGEAKDPRGDDHIEELLSQLQGIFGKLSRSEEEEAQAKIDPPPPAPPPQTPPPETITPSSFPTVPDAPMISLSVPDSVSGLPADIPPPPPVEVPVESPAAEISQPPASDSPALPMEADKSAVYSLIFYPPNRENEAKTLMEKVETMTPRFTKVAFQIKVAGSIPIDPKVDPRESILPNVQEGIRAVFVIVDRPMEEIRRKTITGGLEPRGIYVHEVPALSVEKKAFYTDLLLGMVFFYDSLKSGTD